jgi:hypothetical protein
MRDDQSSQAPSGPLRASCTDGSGAGGDRLLLIEVQAVIEPRVKKSISWPPKRIEPASQSLRKWIFSALMSDPSAKESLWT